MTENRPLSGEIDLASSELPSQEAQLRQALESMGGRRLGSTPSPQAGSSRQTGASPAQRHRYVRDGEVPVVHATLGRSPAKPDATAQQDKALADFLRQELERERTAREAAERTLNETRTSLTTTQTRLAHVEMDLQAAQEQAATQLIQAQQALEEAAAATLEEPAPPQPVRHQSKPARKRVAKTLPDAEPEPVKWWIKVERP